MGGTTGNFTLFTNDTGGAGGALDYIKDVFPDISLEATSNSGLTSTSLTNPLGAFFSNDDTPAYSAKTLYIKDILLIDDRSKWINFKPTYRLVFTENCPNVVCYAFGNVALNETPLLDSVELRSNKTNVLTIVSTGDGVGLTAVGRRVGWLVNDNSAATATAQLQLDSVNTNTIDFSSQGGSTTRTPNYSLFQAQASNETNNIHDFRIISQQANTLKIVGVVVYFENSGANIEIKTGTTYVDKTKITTSGGSSMALPTFGSSLGGNALVLKASTGAYTTDITSASTILSIAQGSSGTNTFTVGTGHGGSFPAGYGFVVEGSSLFVGSVLSVSTDTLTVSPTLPFGISNTIYRAWASAPTLTISGFTLTTSIDVGGFWGYANSITSPLLDVNGKYAVWGANLGASAISNINTVLFLGASGFLQIDGFFSALDFETVGDAIFAATLSVNGTPSWSVNAGQTGIVKRTVCTDMGVGWNSVVLGCGASMGIAGISKVNLYQRNNTGATAGVLAQIEAMNSYTYRSAINATLMSLGTHRRLYADQMYLKGAWTRGITVSQPGGVFYYGTSTNSVMTMQYFGKDFALIGTAGGGTLTLDSVGIGLSFNIMRSVGSETWHTVQYTSGTGATSIISAFDYIRTFDEMDNRQNVLYKQPGLSDPGAYMSEIYLDGGSGMGGTNTTVRRYTVIRKYIGKGITINQSTANGDSFLINEHGFYEINAGDRDSGTSQNLAITLNSTLLTTNPNAILYVNGLRRINNNSQGGDNVNVSWGGWLNAGDVVRVQVSSMDNTDFRTNVSITQTRRGGPGNG